ncbi:MAG: hypothetical protein ACLPYS_14575 [Vulcanimicrobiaceae bacterium]
MFRFVNGTINISLPGFGSVEGSWEPDERERDAAWELYVELVTRIAVVELQPGEGSLREALTSLFSLFPTTRELLRKYGPVVGRPSGGSSISLGYIAVTVLNYVLRPVLAKWHPLLLDYENTRDPRVSQIEHESRWSSADELRRTLNDVRSQLNEFADLLATVADVPPLHGGATAQA